MSEDVKTVASRQAQSKAAKQSTLDLLKSKKPSKDTFTLYLTDEDGEKVEVSLTFKSIGATAYDRLVAKHPPKPDQRVDGAVFNIDTFGPALIAACSLDPEMSEQDALDIWESPDWSRGDLMALFTRAVALNNRGIDIPFSVTG